MPFTLVLDCGLQWTTSTANLERTIIKFSPLVLPHYPCSSTCSPSYSGNAVLSSNNQVMTITARGTCGGTFFKGPSTGGSKFYHKKYVKEDWFMWWPMQKTQILPHIRSMNFRSKFIEISDHVSKPKFYYIENQILPQFFGSKSNNDSFCGKFSFRCSKIWVLTRDH